MITVQDIFYYIIYCICLLFSYLAKRENIPGLAYLRLLLWFGLATEVCVEILQYQHAEDNIPYYFYLPLEYGLLVFFYQANCRRPLLKTVLFPSILVFFITSVLLSTIQYGFHGYPSTIFNISCILNTAWITFLFFDLNFIEKIPITKLPLFWIYSALLIFFAGMFFYNGAYTYFLKEDMGLASNLRKYISITLNYILYLLLTYAFICSKTIRKY
jgi:hypothetical protein